MNHSKKIGFLIKAVSNDIKRYIDSSPAVKSREVTGMQHGVINIIGESDAIGKDVFQRDIEERFNLRRPTATKILHLMQQKGLITKKPVDSDARLKKLLLTEKARDIYEQTTQTGDEMQRLMLRDIPKDEVDCFISVLLRISENIKM